MPERKEIDKMLRGLTPKHQRQLSVSSSNALERFAVMEVRRREKMRQRRRLKAVYFTELKRFIFRRCLRKVTAKAWW